MSGPSVEGAVGRASYDAAPVPPGGFPDLRVLVWTPPPLSERLTRALALAVERVQHAPVAVRRSLAGGVALALALVGLAGALPAGDEGIPGTPSAVAVEAGVGKTASATQPLVDVFPSPGASDPVATLPNPTTHGASLVFAVTGEWNGWLRVVLPTAPVGSTGWVRAEAVQVTEHRMRLTVDVLAREVVLRDGGEAVFRAPLAVGTHDLPPPGSTFVSHVLALSNQATPYGTHALVLAGFDNSPDKLFRGRGMVAVHGSDDASVISTGRTVGSIALSNVDAERLASLVTPGTPVDVVGEITRGAPVDRGDGFGP